MHTSPTARPAYILCQEAEERRRCGTAQIVRAIVVIVCWRNFEQLKTATGGEDLTGTFTMWAHPFNHLAAVAAAKEMAAELRSRARMLGLARLTAVAHRGELTKQQQLLQVRQRGLQQFIDDPYPKNSLFHIGFERDRRAVLEAGIPL